MEMDCTFKDKSIEKLMLSKKERKEKVLMSTKVSLVCCNIYPSLS